MVEIVLATGALGAAAFGIVEGLKPWTFGGRCLGLAGFGKLCESLGPLWKALPVAFGAQYVDVLQGIYRGEREEIDRTLRQGIRIGLTADNAKEMASILPNIDAEKLKKAAAALQQGKTVPEASRNVLGRFELAADARVDAAVRLAETAYIGSQKVAASIVALVIALTVGAYLAFEGGDGEVILVSIIVGLAAVPLAPIAKDVATAVQSAAKALGRK